MKKSLLFVVLLLPLALVSQTDTLRVMYYNILGFPQNDPGREAHFKTINNYLRSDIICVCELISNAGADTLLYKALNVNGVTSYKRAFFSDGPDTDNMLFYNGDKLVLKSQTYLTTDLRYINEYVLYYKSQDLAGGGDTIFFYFYIAHLKAGTTVPDEQQRLSEVEKFKQRIDALPQAENIFFGGDLNLYSASEPAYENLINSGVYPLNDMLPAGNWNNGISYAPYHTQSTRLTAFGGGATGGLDDRFDFILFSDDVVANLEKVTYIPGSMKAFGNDGQHYNKALTDPPVNPEMPSGMTQALYQMSDHLPVICDLKVESQASPPGDDEIMITEIMQNPGSVLDSKGEWIELFNPGDQEVNLNGWKIRDAGTDVHTITGPVIVPPGGFAVLGISASAAENGGYECDYQYSGFFLGNGADEIQLLKPDGITLADHIQYDGGPGWPDPNGSSMVFTGTPADDNNNPAFWVVATSREPTFTGTLGDLGIPGTEGSQQNLVQEGFFTNLKVILEGPFNGTGMNTLTGSYIPLSQPFSTSPWNYAGTESVTVLPGTEIVDWVLVELRDALSANQATSSTLFARQAGFLLSDGTIVATDGISEMSFTGEVINNLFAVICHRNHLPVMSSVALVENAGHYAYDFSTGYGQVYGGSLSVKPLAAGIWGIIGGDGDSNGQVNNGDKNDVWTLQAGMNGYLQGDFNLDSEVNNGDKNDIWKPNSGYGSQVP